MVPTIATRATSINDVVLFMLFENGLVAIYV
jgi:hypothetical protein